MDSEEFWLTEHSCRCRSTALQAAGSSTCSLLLQRRRSQPPSSSPGWSLTVPTGWVGVLWRELGFCGGHAAGQREWSWAQQQLRRPRFPQDYPTCAAGTALARELSRQQAAAHAKRPPGKADPALLQQHSPNWAALSGTGELVLAVSQGRALLLCLC